MPRAAAACAVLPLLLFGAAACADDGSQRRFASDPLPPAEIAAVEPTPIPPTPDPVVAVTPVVAPEDLLDARGAADRIYFRNRSELWTVAAAGGDARPLEVPPGATIASLAASPSGDRVAALLTSEDGDTELLVLDEDGEPIRRVADLEQGLGPETALGGEPTSLTWSPQGDQLLVAFAGGGLLTTELEGEPELLVDTGTALAPFDAAWSPGGDAVAYLEASNPDAPADLYVAPAGVPPLDPVPVVTSATPQAVANLAWLPDGSGLLFTEAAQADEAALGGNLWRVDPGGQNRQLVASAGVAGPVAGIADFAPSPDGRAVAYAVFVPGASGPTFHSLWVKQIGGEARLRLPVPPGETVTDLWWTAEGLVWRTVPDAAPGTTDYAGGAFTLYRAGGPGDPEILFAASPVATPVASPAATPRP